MTNIINSKLATMWKYQNITEFFAKDWAPNWFEKVFVIKNLKICPWTYVIEGLNEEKIVGV